MGNMIYLACPYSHEEPEIRDYRYICSYLAAAVCMKKFGHMVFSPITHSHPIAETLGDNKGDWQAWQEFDKRMIDACDELWILPLDRWKDSIGIKAEMEYATEKNKPIRILDEKITEKVKGQAILIFLSQNYSK